MRQASRYPLNELPKEVLICLALTPLAWAFYLVSEIMLSGTISLVQLGMAGLCSLAAFSLRGWGRWLCVAYDALMAGALVFQASQGQFPSLALLQGAAFVIAGGAVFWPATSRAYRQAADQADAGVVQGATKG
ncbi:hypothetical protein [Desulfoferula mesophila]|uniref:Uncharacterized protein n=1 Tax=Desulfoferula mesophila TaxID=3058419 RepID=A0AAU9F322_9BACT|nr:hypothetical protein FAK_20330 [Desulfoferula mesophilus]